MSFFHRPAGRDLDQENTGRLYEFSGSKEWGGTDGNHVC